MKIMAYSPITSWKLYGETVETLLDFIFLRSIITVDGECSHKTKRLFLLGRNYMRNIDTVLKSRDTMLPTKVHVVNVMVFPVVMYGCDMDHKESWALKNWCFWTVVLRKSLESPLDCKEIKPVNPKGDKLWICVESTGAEAEALIRWPPAEKKLTLWKWPWCCARLRAGGEGATEDEMVAWHHWLNGHEFEQTWEIVKDREAWHATFMGSQTVGYI